MSKKFVLEKSGIHNALPVKDKTGIVQVNSDSDSKNLQFKRKYYDLGNNEPLPLVEIETRLKKNFQRMDKISAEVMLDLYFIYCNWETFYNRKDSFSNYLKDNVPLSRAHAYDVIKVVNMLIQYQEFKTNKVSDSPTLLDEDMIDPINEIGIRKLKYLSQVNNQNKQYDMLERLIEGVDIPEKEIREINNDVTKEKHIPPLTKRIEKFLTGLPPVLSEPERDAIAELMVILEERIKQI